MEAFLNEWFGASPDWQHVSRVTVKLLAAMLVGAVVGAQRERSGKPAGLRTHMLVALGTVTFVVTGLEHGMLGDAMSRVIQGLATGIGFIGAGTILKLADEQQIKGLTTAATVWVTAGLGVAIGLGQFTFALLGMALTWMILSVFTKVEDRLDRSEESEEK